MMRTLFLSVCLATSGVLAGCGFTPLHQSSPGGSALSQVQVVMNKTSDIADNNAGFIINQRLRDRIGVNDGTAPYTLSISPNYRRSRLGLTDGDVASRYDVTVRADWRLTESKTGKLIERGRTSTVSTFGAPSGPFGVITADNVGVEQASQQTADKLIIDIARFFASEEY